MNGATDERRWAKDHPEPQVSATEDRLSLWNYPVGRAELSPVHQAAIRRFGAIGMLSPQLSSAEFSIRGHASVSGEGAQNVQLSRDRANAVGSYLRDLGFRSVDVSWAGSAEPADSAQSGQAYARNRRVEVTMFVPPLGELAARPVPLDLGGQLGRVASATRRSFDTPDVSVAFESTIDFDLGTLRTSTVEVDIKIEGTLQGKITGKKGTVGAAAVWKNGKLSAKFEEKLKGELKAKLGIEPPSKNKPASIKLGIQAEKWFLKPEIGLQVKPKFAYFKASLVKARLPEIIFEDVRVSMELSGSAKLEIGPSPTLAARLAPYAVPAIEVVGTTGAATAAVGGAIGAAAVIVGGTIYLTEDARRESVRFVQILARRDGAACRAALETLGGDALVAFKEKELEWRKVGNQPTFAAGVSDIESLLRSLGVDGRKARRDAWVVTYAKGAGPADFSTVRERIFLRLGGYDKDGRNLADDVAQL